MTNNHPIRNQDREIERLREQHTQDISDAFQNGKDTKRAWDLKAATEVKIADQNQEIKRLRDVIDCGCNAIHDAALGSGPWGTGPLQRAKAIAEILLVSRRMRREMTVEVDDG